ncbi:hypothetical protein NPIL_530391 [Nephila pilipes]|uniref:Uncharacterized protein n=1 Tax=Nephila pilipes TaxID=299642 RepID=A0A8X6T0W8_NEPPI|nr:hypothetical protein NPIL_530391 [Nephila pilipes]
MGFRNSEGCSQTKGVRAENGGQARNEAGKAEAPLSCLSLINPWVGKLFAFLKYFLFHSEGGRGTESSSAPNPHPLHVSGNPISRHQRQTLLLRQVDPPPGV